ncbi:MAG TPA: CAP domain-containing protein [Methanoregulaceae archaeon]|nr:MAG: hypothetical protein IPI71_00200 [Methanolinea sp.]HON82481.1 CAP domain-containing protein [Methanoregulaceae archaeon]HPD11624.1 CAP domain-containing protein [Methanoregulaceae archaeon]HRS50784.1 CAP domain-containing protein [Candidatus Cloacimonadota bacterium]
MAQKFPNVKWSFFWICIHTLSVILMTFLLKDVNNYLLFLVLAGFGITIVARTVRSFTRKKPFRLDFNFVFWALISIISFGVIEQILFYFQIEAGLFYFVLMGFGIYTISQVVIRITYSYQKMPYKNKNFIKSLFTALIFFSVLFLIIQSQSFFSGKYQNPPTPTPKTTGKYAVGNVATDDNGLEGMVITGNNFAGQYSVLRVYLDHSGKGWHTNGPQNPQSVNYEYVESQFPIKWGGGNVDPTHIANKDWSLPENWKSPIIVDDSTHPPETQSNSESAIITTPSSYSSTQAKIDRTPAQANSQIVTTTLTSQIPTGVTVPITEILNKHNYYRNKVTGANIPNLVWSTTLATSAEKWAYYLGGNNLFQHSGGHSENLAAGYTSWTSAIDGWGSEESNFIYAPFGNAASKTGNWHDVGHYTQIVWKTTTQCGCGCAPHPTYGTVYVCQYAPAGNIFGYYPY